MDWEYLKLKIQPLLDVRNNISSEKLKRNPELVKEMGSLMPSFYNIREIYYAIKNKIEERPLCSCGDPLGLFRVTFPMYCSKDCVNLIPDWYAKKTNTLLERYGTVSISGLSEIRKKAEDTLFEKYGVRNPSQILSSKEKTIITNRKKYGKDHYAQTDEFLERYQTTCNKKYGVDNVSQLDAIKNKKKETCLENWGVEYSLQNKEIRERIKETNLEKYGVEFPIQNKEIKTRAKETSLHNWGVEEPLSSPDVQNKRRKTNLERYGAENATQCEEVINKRIETSRQIYKETTLVDKLQKMSLDAIFPNNWSTDDYVNGYTKYQFIHDECKTIFTSNFINGLLPRCPKCHYNHQSSNIELKLREELINIFGLAYISHSNRNLINPYELDIVIDEKLVIEVNGTYWHRDGSKALPLLEKSKLSPLPLLHFWDYELENKYDICLSIILSKMNKYEEVIYARKCEIREVNSKDATEFLNKNHLQGQSNSSIRLGLYHNDELVQIITFGKSRFNKKYDYEIHRLASKLNTKVIGGVSKLFKRVREILSGNSLITYADKRYSNGDIYRTLGFGELPDSKPNYLWVRADVILTRYQCQKHKLKDLLKTFDDSLSESENMLANNYHKIKDCGNKVFTINL